MTPRRRLLVFCAIGVVLAWGACPAGADQDANLARGFSPGELYDYSGLDSVNLYNGALGLMLPVGPRYPVGDQLSYGLTLSYNSNVWDPDARATKESGTVVRMLPRRSSNAGLGWSISLGGQLYGPTNPIGDPPLSAGFQWESEDGATHVFYFSLHDGESSTCAYTRDNTYLRLCGAGDERAIEFPDGTVRTFARVPVDERISTWDIDRFRLTRIEDRLGNWVEVDYSPGTWEIEDSLGRSHTVSFVQQYVDTWMMWRLTEANLQGFAGGRALYGFAHETVNIARSCKTTDGSASVRIDVPLLRSVTLPAEAGAFLMPVYNRECGNLKDRPGTLTRLDLPTGGRLVWTYRSYQFETPDPGDPLHIVVEQAAGVASKQALDAAGLCPVGPSCTWSYGWQILDEEHRRTLVTTPLGDTHVSYFRQRRPHRFLPGFTGWDQGLPFSTAETSGGLYISEKVYDGPAVGTPVRSTYVAYEHDQLRAGIPQIWSQDWLRSNRRVTARRTVYRDDGSKFTAVELSDFDGLGHFRAHEATGNLGDPSFHIERTDYNPARGTYAIDPATNAPDPAEHTYTPWPDGSPWVISTYASKRSEEPATATQAQTCFDASTGRLLRARRQAAPGHTGSHDVVVAHLRTRVSASEIRHETRTYGGDGQTVGTGPNLCSIGLPGTPVYRLRETQLFGTLARTEPLTPAGGSPILRTLDLGIDPSTGLAVSSTDPAGLATDFTYDLLGRLLWLEPRFGGDALTEIDYETAVGTAPAQVTLLRRPNGNRDGSVLAESRFVFDPFGRPQLDERKVPGQGWTGVKTTYNALGWVTEVSERERSSSGFPNTTVYSSFDPFGRPHTIRPPDGQDHVVSVNYFGARLVERTISIGTGVDAAGEVVESDFKTSEFYDSYGRLARVREPSGTAGAQVDTDYTYDAAGRLVQVSTTANGATQNRFFDYDGRGFLLHETHPELGPSGDGMVEYLDYDAGGHATRKRVGASGGRFDLRFAFDGAGRIVEVREVGGAQRLLKEFVYGTSQSSGDRSKGKIKTAVRHNHVVPPGGSGEVDATVTETTTYGGRGGRASARTTVTNFGPPFRFNQGWEYDMLGDVSRRIYPSCSFAPCAQQTSNRSVDFVHTQGYLTAVPGFTDTVPGQPPGTGLTYHPNGMLHQLQHANGVLYIQENDVNSMRRPGSLRVEGQTAPQPLAGSAFGTLPGLVYRYDGAGNVVGIRDERYLYDGVSRVVAGLMEDPAYRQQYTYDPFGNVTSVTTDRPGAPTDHRDLGIVPTTNRLSSVVYDDAGNQLNWGSYAFGYDSFNMMRYLDGGGNDAIHVYTAADERFYVLDVVPDPDREVFTLRDLDGKVLRSFLDRGGVDGDWTETTDYVYRDGKLLASVRPGEGIHHFHPDHLGSPRMITDQNGVVLALHGYFPYGEELVAGSDAEPMKFTGHERDFNADPATTDDLDYMHARYYSMWLGRFLSMDPANSEALGLPQTWNRYSYARDNPLRFLDPDGRQEQLPNQSMEDQFDPIAVVDRILGSQVWFVDENTAKDLQKTSEEIKKAMVLAAAISSIARSVLPSDARSALTEIEDEKERSNVRNPRRYRNDGSGGAQVLPTHDEEGNPITYTEHTVNPRQPGASLDSNRIVEGSDGKFYYSDDHYKTFKRIEDDEEVKVAP